MKFEVYAKMVSDRIRVSCDIVDVLEAIKNDLKVEVNLNKLSETFTVGNKIYKNTKLVLDEEKRKATLYRAEEDHYGGVSLIEDSAFWFAPDEWEAFKALRKLITYYEKKGILE